MSPVPRLPRPNPVRHGSPRSHRHCVTGLDVDQVRRFQSPQPHLPPLLLPCYMLRFQGRMQLSQITEPGQSPCLPHPLAAIMLQHPQCLPQCQHIMGASQIPAKGPRGIVLSHPAHHPAESILPISQMGIRNEQLNLEPSSAVPLSAENPRRLQAQKTLATGL